MSKCRNVLRLLSFYRWSLVLVCIECERGHAVYCFSQVVSQMNGGYLCILREPCGWEKLRLVHAHNTRNPTTKHQNRICMFRFNISYIGFGGAVFALLSDVRSWSIGQENVCVWKMYVALRILYVWRCTNMIQYRCMWEMGDRRCLGSVDLFSVYAGHKRAERPTVVEFCCVSKAPDKAFAFGIMWSTII